MRAWTRSQGSATVLSQILQSAANFVATITFARVLDLQAFGIVATFWLVWTLVMSANRAIFGEQLLTGAVDGVTGYVQFSLMLFLVGSPISIVALLALQGEWQLVLPVMFGVGFACSDGVRYAAFAARWSSILKVDSVRVTLAAIGFLVSLSSDSHLAASIIMTCSTLPWLVLGLLRVWGSDLRAMISYVLARGTFEIQMAFQFAITTLLSQALPLLMLPRLGPAAFATIRLAQSFANPAATLLAAFQPELIRRFSRIVEPSGHLRDLRKVGAAWVGLALLLSCFGFVMAWFLLPALIGQEKSDQVSALLLPAFAGVLFVASGQPGGALIRCLRLGSISLTGQLMGLAISLVAILVALHEQSVVGTAWALALGSAATVVISYVLLFRYLMATRSRGSYDDEAA
jgi:hypothetical protein